MSCGRYFNLTAKNGVECGDHNGKKILRFLLRYNMIPISCDHRYWLYNFYIKEVFLVATLVLVCSTERSEISGVSSIGLAFLQNLWSFFSQVWFLFIISFRYSAIISHKSLHLHCWILLVPETPQVLGV